VTAAVGIGEGAVVGLPTLAKYELLGEIGHGGMATVYRARDRRLGRQVAVKIIHKHLRDNVEVATRFLAEARAAAKLRHPGIVEVFDVSGEDDRERFLVCELLRGTTLRQVLLKHRDMPAEVGAAIVLDLCDALAHAHEAGIIHRDVKPENVLVECPRDRCAQEDGELDSDAPSAADASRGCVVIKLTDFGIAKILDAQGMTSTGQVLGSPAHMAPEQIEGGEVDARTDVFALGVLMYECLVGHLPFEGKNPAQVLRRVLDGLYSPADRERATVGGRWASIIAGGLQRDPALRTASPDALAAQIRAELSALGVADPSALVSEYFAAPSSFTDRFQEQLVPRLVTRGEAARRASDRVGAAADFNRALALRPGDAAILKRVTGLTSSVSRRRTLRRVGLIGLSSAVLGLGAFALVRLTRPGVTLGEAPRAEELDRPARILPMPMLAPSLTVPSNLPAVDRPRPRLRLRLPASSSALVSQTPPRRVRFSLVPNGAKLIVDGTPRDWFGETFTLPIGPHAVSASVPGLKCCKRYDGSTMINTAPDDQPDSVQVIVIKLETNPATVSLTGAPDKASVTCGELGLTLLAGAPKSCKLPDAQWEGSCFFQDAEGKERGTRKVTLRAGEANSIAWF
jgi:serine/threonine-protein kinase